jgi:hypothetical protein
MKTSLKVLLACVPVALIAACGGGGDLQDRLDVADPVVRFVHASPIAPNLTLNRAGVALPDATNVPYKSTSNYADIDMGSAAWTVTTATTPSVTLGTVNIDPVRGDKYTIVALPASSTDSSTYLIIDPYNKPLTSTSTRLRLMNASFNTASLDLYMNQVGTDITTAGVNPLVAATTYKTSGPASGSDSVDIPGGTYQVSITTAGTKTVVFKGLLTFGNNQDILMLTVPDATLPGGIKALVKIEGTAAMTEVPVTP